MFNYRDEYGTIVPVKDIEGIPLVYDMLHDRAKKKLPPGTPYELRGKLDKSGVAWYYSPEVMEKFLSYEQVVLDAIEEVPRKVIRVFTWEPKKFSPPILSEDGGHYLIERSVA